MGLGRGVQLPIWILILTFICVQKTAYATSKEQFSQQSGDAEDYPFSQEDDEESTETVQLVSQGPHRQTSRPLITAHNDQVCSTWGNFHFKTFDGNVYHFPGTCNYLFASNCKSDYEEFNIQIRRTVEKDIPTFTHITLKLEGEVVELVNRQVIVNGQVVELPYSHSAMEIDRNGLYLRMFAKVGLEFKWNEEDAIVLELDGKYAGQICGLCGDFNDVPKNEFISNGMQMTALQYGNLQKVNGPEEQCEDLTVEPLNNCTDHLNTCDAVLSGPAFSACNHAINVQPYVKACEQDLCRCNNESYSFCLCNTFTEYSRQCSHSGSKPLNWRTEDQCPITCPFNMLYEECGLPCVDTCSNTEQSELCDDHCTDGCYCPKGTVYDDITNTGCIKQRECPCTFNGKTYGLGTGYKTACHDCTCAGGSWDCKDLPCVGHCSIDGGSHITTFDETYYNFHGDCTYVLAKDCSNRTFSVMAEVRTCGKSETDTCLKSITVSHNGGDKTFFIKPDGTVLMDMVYAHLPIHLDGISLFEPSSSFIIVHTSYGLQMEIELKPLMQVRVRLEPYLEGTTCGLCGNFNKNPADDFMTMNGVVEGTGASFANNWKTQSDCPNIKNIHEDPCAASIENEEYAEHWCEKLSEPEGPFKECHAMLNPSTYEKNCMFDTCKCQNTEDCMCASVSAYVRACAAKGIFLDGWRSEICDKYSDECHSSQVYTYSADKCQATCHSLIEADPTCNTKFFPVDGCVCPEETYLDEDAHCVTAAKCDCYYKGSSLAHGETVHESIAICTCLQGRMSCIGAVKEPECVAPMVFFDCANVSSSSKGSECQKSCQTYDVECYSTHCVSGCVCPHGLVLNEKGDCIKEDACPCVHNEVHYQPGENISVSCNTCICKDRKWQCTDKPCFGTCTVYGDGHYITFDSKRYSFSGDCQYTLAQDYCGNGNNGTFRVITENIPCGTTGTTCSKSIKYFLGGYELILHEAHIDVVERDSSVEVPYRVRYMGIYMVIESKHGVVLMWDKKTSIFIKLTSDFKSKVCGLCGNFDANGMNDFTTRSQSVGADLLEFGNSWKVTPTCPDALETKDACTIHPYRKAWAQKQCSIIKSDAFSKCHSQVDPSKYYEDCVTDSCACDAGGDCECFCTAVASYAQACSEFGVCIHWRTPDICPLFCDFYNLEGDCEWHYKPCGSPCMKTCRNPSGKCLYELSGLEGCYPKCPEDRPYFDEEKMACTASCGCYDKQGNLFRPEDKVSTEENCKSCTCTMKGFKCNYDLEACFCRYGGKKFKFNEVIYRTGDNLGGCFVATCAANGTIHREITECTTSPPSTVLTFTTNAPTSSVTSAPILTTVCVRESCTWTGWLDHSYPKHGPDGGDYETLDLMEERGENVCKTPRAIRCRAAEFPNATLDEIGQVVECSPKVGLICNNKDQSLASICNNYQVSFECCSHVPCGSTTATTTAKETTTGEVTTTSEGPTSSKHETAMPVTTVTTESTPGGESEAPITTTQSTLEIPETSTTTTTGKNTPPPSTSEIPVTESTSTASTTTVTETTSPAVTGCEPKCQWSQWFDDKKPTSEPDDGDHETFENIIASGKTICEKSEKISDIECRAEDYPNTDITEFGQNVHCNVSYGLVCNNADQTDDGDDDMKTCYNYKMRVLCCDITHCITPEGTTIYTTTPEPTAPSTAVVTETPTTTNTTSAPPTTTGTETATTIGKTVPDVTESTKFPSTTSESTTVTESTTKSPITPITETTSPGATACEPKCQWSQWFDDKKPTSEPDDGDHETFENIIASGKTICEKSEKISDIQCKAEDYPNTDINKSGQNVHCNVTYGLVCNNAEQTSDDDDKGDDDMKTCYNYKMRVLCCDITHCISPEGTTIHTTAPETTAPSTAVVTETHTTASSTSAPSTTTGTEIATTTGSTVPDITESTTLPSKTSESTTGTESTTKSPITPVTETTSPGATACEPKCQWSQWFDDKKPTSEPDDGDHETFENIIASGKTICSKSEKISDIECRAEDYPDTDITEFGQNVHCNVTYGLVCNNAEQTSDEDYDDDDMKTCYNYKMRVLCCDITHCITPEGTTIYTTTPEPTAPSTAVVTETPTTTNTTSAPPTTTGTETATTIGKTVPDVTESTKFPSTTSESTTVTESTTKSPITPITETTSPGATACEPKCQWSQWFDDKKPTSEPDDGDHETFENIIASGKTICEKSEKISDIQCRAEDYPNTDINKSGQNVHCNVTYGLVCNNAEQTSDDDDKGDDDMKTCYNYKMRVLCCDITHCISPEGTTIHTTAPETTAPSTAVVTETHTTASSTSAPSTTTGTEIATTTGSTVPDITESTTLPSKTSESTTGTESTTKSPITPVTETTSPGATACEPKCQWSQWFDDKKPTSEPDDGDHETFENIIASGKTICSKSEKISDIECRAEDYPDTDITEFGQNVHCNVTYGLVCNNAEQTSDEDYDDDDMKTCYNYKMRVLCCDITHCITPEGTTIYTTTPEPTAPSTAVVTETPTTTNTTSAPPTTTGTETATTIGKTVPDVAESTKFPSTTSESTTVTESTTKSPITPITETTSPGATACEPKCQWSQWFDDKKPTSEPDDGDHETFENIIASGKTICEKSEKISDIQCRAEDYPNTDINKSGQNVHCNVTYGLVCNNAEQTSDDDDKGDDDMKTCYNYKMRVLCCDITHCISPEGTTIHTTAPETTAPSTAVVTETHTTASSTSAPSTTTGTEIATTTGSTVPDITESTTLPSKTSESTTGTESTTKSPITPVTETTSPGATACEPKCQWSQWFDDKKPTSEPDDGDLETFENIIASGKTICSKSEKISDIECRAEDYPDTDITEFGQNVHCNVTYGLVCNNAEQTSDEDYDDDDMKTCYNYKMRVLCCDITHCITPEGTTIYTTTPEPTAPSTAVVTETPTTTNTTSAPPTTTGTETATTIGKTVPDVTESTKFPSTTSESTTVTESTTKSPITPITETTSPGTTACEPKCQWSQWFDDKKPTSEPDDGDHETFENIIASGKTICSKSEKISDIECRAEDYPDTDITEFGQNVHCNVTYGLVCNNAEQTSDEDYDDDDMKTCYNYKMRVLCCDITHCITPEGTTIYTTTPEPTAPSTAVVTETPTTTNTTSAPPTTTGTETATTIGKTVPDVTESTKFPSTTSESTTVTESTTKSPKTPITETTSPGATACEPKCQWSQWFDDKKPTSEPDDGDHETFENIIASGKTICSKSEKISDIECRAEDYPDTDITEFGQNVHCNVTYGLVCNNAEQTRDEDYDDDDMKTCYNYKMRVLCCDITHCITPEGTTIYTTTPEPTAPSTAVVTETPTTTNTTSAPPTTTGTETATTIGKTVPDVTESTKFPSTTSESTTVTESTTKSPITPITETTSPGATACEPKCQWSQWFDDKKPTSEPDDGDHETFENIIASGKTICEKSEKISDIQCRAEDYPNTDITEFGQNVHCNVTYGLVCNNAEQTRDEDYDDDDMKTCYNYKMRVLCCDITHCITPEGTTIYTTTPEPTAPSTAVVTETPTTTNTTSAPPTTTGTETATTIGKTVPDVTESTKFPSTTSESTTVTESTTKSPITPITETTSPGATACEPKCQWSQWFDDKKPTSEPDDGDHETFENIIASGKTICEKSEKISDIQCRAEDYPNTDITEFGQNVHCNVTYGLVCNNAEQTSDDDDDDYDDEDLKTCYNYKMRVLCCDITHCITSEGTTIYTTAPETTAPSTAVVTETHTTATSTSALSTTTGTETATTTGSTVPDITESTTRPSTTSESTTGTESTTTSPITPVTETTSPAVTVCEPKCQWSQWFDDKKPTSEPDDGDHETFENIIASGKTICEKSEKIRDIECRAEDYPDTDITEFGQNVHCNVTYGLVCNNAEQTSDDDDKGDDDTKTCYNYKMRVLCCDITHCITPDRTTIHTTAPSTAVVTETHTTAISTSAPSTTTGTESATTTGRTVPDVTESTTFPSTTSGSTTGTDSTTTSPITPVTETTSPAATACEPKCQWSQWFDDKKPTSGPDDGDHETFENIIASGKPICEKSEKISDIECRAEDYPDTDITEFGQNVHCNVSYGLVCNNAEQTSDDDDDEDDDRKTCYNYKMRVLCCDNSHCIISEGTTIYTTAPETAGVTETPTTASSTSAPSKPAGTETVTTTGRTVPDGTESTTFPSTTSESSTGTESATTSPITPVTETTSPAATACEPKCQWSQWFDDKKPTSEPDDGDHETFENIIASGKTICEKSEKISDIECRAEDYPDTDITEFGQNVHCNVTYGLVCNNAEQTSDEDDEDEDDDIKTCHNYKMRVLCCDNSHCINSEGTTIYTTAPEKPAPSTAGVTETPTTASSTSAPSTTTGTETVTTTGRTVPDVTESTTFPSTTPESSTGTESTTTSPITPVTETTSPAATACEPKCQWSQWFDDKKPTSEPDDGDHEIFENIIASGKPICEKSEKISDIECRAEDYPDTDITEFGQNVHCNVSYGLVCNNAEQTSDDDDDDEDDDRKTCYNYKMRVLCCDNSHCITSEGTTIYTTAPETAGVTETPTTASRTSAPSKPAGTETVTTTGRTVPDGTESTTFPSTTSESSTGTESTTTSPITPVTETTVPAATACEPKCQWSQWFDDKKPTSEPDDGDHETFENIIASGKTICEKSEKISDIECRAEDYPDTDITEFGQNVHCNVTYGLVCNNAEQTSDEDDDDEDDDIKTCYNYKMRVLCCDNSHCINSEGTTIYTTAPETTAPSTAGVTETPTTASSTSAPSTTTGTETVTTTGRTVPDVTESTTFPSTTPESSTGTESTTTSPITPVTETTSPAATACEPKCQWSQWFDDKKPTSEPDDGDQETFENIIASGKPICEKSEKISDIECRAEDYPDTDITEFGQNVHCNVSYGLVCNNAEQTSDDDDDDEDDDRKTCYNYKMRVLCCDNSHCITSEGTTIYTTAPETAGVTETPTTVSSTSAPSKPAGTETVTTTGRTVPDGTESTTFPSTTSESSTGTESTTTSHITPVTETTVPAATACEPKCQWSQWFDDKKPTSEPDDGDYETFENIIASGKTICEKSEKISDIECRAEDYPDTDITEFGQNVHCNVTYGLVCNNAEQTSEEDNDDEDDDIKTCYNYKMRVLCCDNSHCINSEGTTIYTTAPETTAPSTAGVTETPTTASSTSAPSTTTGTETVTTTGRTVPDVTESTTFPSTTSESSTGTESTTTSPITPVTETTSPAATACEPKCQWSQWFDDKKPTSEPDDGDHETFENIISSGKTICSKSEKISDIECRAEDYPDIDITEFGQNVHCNVTYGLVCNNAEQTSDEYYDDDDMKTCYNYKMRVLCCDNTHCITPLTPERTTIYTTAPEKTAPSTAVVTETPTTTSNIGTPSTIAGTEPSTTTGSITHIVTETTAPSTSESAVTETTTPAITSGTESSTTTSSTSTGTEPTTTTENIGQIVTRTPSLPPITSETTTITETTTVTTSHDIKTTSSSGMTSVVSETTTAPSTTGEEIPTEETSPENTGTSTTTHHISSIPQTSEETSTSTSSQCWCHYNDILFAPGEVVYNETDLEGCSFHAVCSELCEIDRFLGTCKHPTPPNTTTSSTSEISTLTTSPASPSESATQTTTPSPSESLPDTAPQSSEVLPTTVHLPTLEMPDACYQVDPPREVGETWEINKCVNATCEEGGNITITHRECPAVKEVTCESGLAAKQVYDQDGCCFQYECESCVGPDGKSKMPGDTWMSNCQQCACDKEKIAVACVPMTCEEITLPKCDEEGYELNKEVVPDNPCCTKMTCTCNPLLCIPSLKNCDVGFRLSSIIADGDCCAKMQCVPENVCVFNNVTYQPGSNIPQTKGSCKVCDCIEEINPETQLHDISCQDIRCNTECAPGYEYKMKDGECCGECVQNACVKKREDGGIKVIEVGETWYPNGNRCTYYECDIIEDQFIPVTVKRACPISDDEECADEDMVLAADGCCKICRDPQPESCTVQRKSALLAHGECNTTVELAACEGLCSSSSMFSSMSDAMEHKCTCCQELKTSKQEADLTCADGSVIGFSYILVEECGCKGTLCAPREGTTANKAKSRRHR